MKLLFAFYALASFWLMVAPCRAAKTEKIASLCERLERIRIAFKEIP